MPSLKIDNDITKYKRYKYLEEYDILSNKVIIVNISYIDEIYKIIDESKAKNDCNLRSVKERQASIKYILCNKFASISSDKLIRRTKDIFDVFIIDKYIEEKISYSEILKEMKLRGRKLGNFYWFKNNDRIEKVKIALEKYKPNPIKEYSVDYILTTILEKSLKLERESILERERIINNDYNR